MIRAGIFWLLATLATGYTAAGEPVTLRLMSWNIRHATSMDGKENSARQIEVIKAARPDIVGLQEVDEKCGRSGRVDQPAHFAEALGMTPYFASFMPYNGGRYGLALLSKAPQVSARTIVLPPGKEPRSVALVELRTAGGQGVLVANLHLDNLSASLRQSQIATLLKALADSTLPAIVFGDYNAEPGSETLAAMHQAGFRFIEKPADNHLTWNARSPSVEIDHVAIRDGSTATLTGQSIQVIDEPEASDHRPVLAEIILQPRAAQPAP